jgi:hypothetical protein
VAVCLLQGTELAFEEDVKCESAYGFGYKRLAHKVARFRQVNQDQPNVHHDALELPDGEIVLVTKLAGGSTRPYCKCQSHRSKSRSRQSHRS